MSRATVISTTFNVVLRCDKCQYEETYYVRADTRVLALKAVNDIEKEWNGWTFKRRNGKVKDICPTCSKLHKCPQCHGWVKNITSRGNCISCAGAGL